MFYYYTFYVRLSDYTYREPRKILPYKNVNFIFYII